MLTRLAQRPSSGRQSDHPPKEILEGNHQRPTRVRVRTYHFDYTFEAYKSAAKRTYGHYVMAIFNTDGTFTGRADVNREGHEIEIRAFYTEVGAVQRELEVALDAARSALRRQLEHT